MLQMRAQSDPSPRIPARTKRKHREPLSTCVANDCLSITSPKNPQIFPLKHCQHLSIMSFSSFFYSYWFTAHITKSFSKYGDELKNWLMNAGRGRGTLKLTGHQVYHYARKLEISWCLTFMIFRNNFFPTSKLTEWDVNNWLRSILRLPPDILQQNLRTILLEGRETCWMIEHDSWNMREGAPSSRYNSSQKRTGSDKFNLLQRALLYAWCTVGELLL